MRSSLKILHKIFCWYHGRVESLRRMHGRESALTQSMTFVSLKPQSSNPQFFSISTSSLATLWQVMEIALALLFIVTLTFCYPCSRILAALGVWGGRLYCPLGDRPLDWFSLCWPVHYKTYQGDGHPRGDGPYASGRGSWPYVPRDLKVDGDDAVNSHCYRGWVPCMKIYGYCSCCYT